jgi:hypothetical protein
VDSIRARRARSGSGTRLDPIEQADGIPRDQLSIERGQTGVLPASAVPFRTTATGRSTLPGVPSSCLADEPERWSLREALGRRSLPSGCRSTAAQVGQRQLDIPLPARIARVPLNEFAQAQTLVQLGYHNTVGSHPRALKLEA